MKSKSAQKETGKVKEKKVSSAAIAPKDYVPRIKVLYKEKVIPAMMKEFDYKNPMQVPRVERIVLNVGMGEAVQNVKLLESAAAELEQITGQKPVLTRAKKAIAGFKLREGIPIGTKVTLEGRGCLSFWIGWYRWHCQESETFVVFLRKRLMEGAITHWV